MNQLSPKAENISIHALLAESDLVRMLNRPHSQISIHALLAESDPALRILLTMFGHFYPRSPCGERQQEFTVDEVQTDISIHALLAESDAVGR